MILSQDIKNSIDKSVLCWLATASKDGVPNVSPKEIFTYYNDKQIIIANIASPQTVKNIQQNSSICISFIDILVQKGFQLKGEARIIDKSDAQFFEMEAPLLKMTKGGFPFATITVIDVQAVKKILAPSYLFYPETLEKDQIENAKKAYNL